MNTSRRESVQLRPQMPKLSWGENQFRCSRNDLRCGENNFAILLPAVNIVNLEISQHVNAFQ